VVGQGVVKIRFRSINLAMGSAVPISHDVSEVLVANTITAEDAKRTTTTASEKPPIDEELREAIAQGRGCVVDRDDCEG
jgi:hypothetical protein